MEARTLRNRIDKIFEVYKIENIAFQRLRKTNANGQADVAILEDVFSGNQRMVPYKNMLDKDWLREEMTNDLTALLFGYKRDLTDNFFYDKITGARCNYS